MNPTHRHEPSSSFDSAEPGSHHGTPDTRLTALSPEEFRLGQGPVTKNQPPAFSLGAVPPKGSLKGNTPKTATVAYHDPFVSSKTGPIAVGSEEPPRKKLSPIAPAFDPLAHLGNIGESVVSSTLLVPVNSSRGGIVYSPGSHQSSPLMPETPHDHVSLETPLLSMKIGRRFSHSSQGSSPSVQSPGTHRPATKSGQFSSDGFCSRSVVITHVNKSFPAAEMENLLSVSPAQVWVCSADRP